MVISIRMRELDYLLLKTYARHRSESVSSFVRKLVEEKIEAEYYEILNTYLKMTDADAFSYGEKKHVEKSGNEKKKFNLRDAIMMVCEGDEVEDYLLKHGIMDEDDLYAQGNAEDEPGEHEDL